MQAEEHGIYFDEVNKTSIADLVFACGNVWRFLLFVIYRNEQNSAIQQILQHFLQLQQKYLYTASYTGASKSASSVSSAAHGSIFKQLRT